MRILLVGKTPDQQRKLRKLRRVSMHGGKRDGAGRRRGSPNRASARREQSIANTGRTPMDILVRAMRYFDNMADRALNQKNPNEKRVSAAFKLAVDVATKAAPYIHQRLATVDHTPQFDLKRLTESEQVDVIRLLVKADPTGNAARIADTLETGQH